MENNSFKHKTHRRGFLGLIASGAAAIGLSSLAPLHLDAAPLLATAKDENGMETPDEWFNKIKGKHRIVFDSTHPEGLLPFVWPRVFLMTNGKTGSPPADCGVVVVLRHSSIAYAFEDQLWEKYKFGEVFKADDPATKAPATHNPFWKPKAGAFKMPGVGEVQIGINELQGDGVMFCVCDAAITVYSAVVADMMKMDAADVKKDWVSGLLPGIMPVPSGVWAVGRAQEHHCGYCYVGE